MRCAIILSQQQFVTLRNVEVGRNLLGLIFSCIKHHTHIYFEH